MNLLVTGGCGFIGSHFIEDSINLKEINLLVNLDCCTYASNKNLPFENNIKYHHIKLDISKESILSVLKEFRIDCLIHFAAESHVDNSIRCSNQFVETNIVGTHNILKSCLQYNYLKKIIHISTDEVFGSLLLDDKPFTKESPYKPNSPYAASKASSDLLVRSYVKTHGIPAIITNCSNNFGPRQFPEKFIPLCLKNLTLKKPIPIYGDGKNIRDWIYVKDHVKAILKILFNGEVGEQYLIGGNKEISNIDLANLICEIYEKITNKKIDWDCFCYVEDRKGHDLRYSIDLSEFREKFTDFELTSFDDSIYSTVKSYIN